MKEFVTGICIQAARSQGANDEKQQQKAQPVVKRHVSDLSECLSMRTHYKPSLTRSAEVKTEEPVKEHTMRAFKKEGAMLAPLHTEVHSLFDQLEAVPPEEGGAAVNGILVVGVDLRRLLLVDGDVARLLQLGGPEL
eukprot:1157837-Pelagomonas_calceolata.AAC.13